MKIVDLSHPLINNMPTYPSDPDVSIKEQKSIKTSNSSLHSIYFGTHTGTHCDVHAHIKENGKKLHQYPISNFIGSAIKLDKKTYKEALDFIDNINGLIFDSGFSNKFNYPEVFYGRNRPKIPDELVEILMEKKLQFFGCDLPSVDSSGSKEKPVHNALLGSDYVIYESLANLDQIPVLEEFRFIGLPLNFIGLDGSPVRAIAELL